MTLPAAGGNGYEPGVLICHNNSQMICVIRSTPFPSTNLFLLLITALKPVVENVFIFSAPIPKILFLLAVNSAIRISHSVCGNTYAGLLKYNASNKQPPPLVTAQSHTASCCGKSGGLTS